MHYSCIASLFLAQGFLPLLLAAPTVPMTINAPKSPAGFQIEVIYHTPLQLLNPAGVYICAIQALAEWSGPSWDSMVHHDRLMEEPQLGVRFGYARVKWPKIGYRLQLSHLLLGLYQTVISMTEHNRFFMAATTFKENGRYIAAAVMGPIPRGPSSNNALASAAAAGNGTLSDESGQIQDTKYGWLKIEWSSNGIRVQASEIFTTIMDAIISTADEPGTRDRSYIYGVSSSGNTAMNLHSVDGSLHRLTNKLIQDALLLITRHVFVKQRKFEEVDFTMFAEGNVMARGFLMDLGKVKGNATLESVTGIQ